MKFNFRSQQIYLLIALLMVIPIFISGCGKASQNEDGIVLDGRYEMTEIDLGGYVPVTPSLVGDKLMFIGEKTVFEDEEYIGLDYRIFTLDTDTLEISSLPMEGIPSENAVISCCSFDDTGACLVAESLYDGGVSSVTLHLLEYGEERWNCSLDGFSGGGRSVYTAFLNGMWYAGHGKTLVGFDREGNNTLRSDVPGEILGVFSASNKLHAYTLNGHYILSGSTLEESVEWAASTRMDGPQGIYFGGDFDYLKVNDRYLTGYVIGGEEKQLINWTNSDLSDFRISSVTVLSDEVVFLVVWSMGERQENNFKLLRMNKVEDFVIPASHVVRLLYSEDGNRVVPQLAARFNLSQNEYRIICDEYVAGETGTANSLGVILASEKNYDIIELCDENAIEIFTSKNYFTDLYRCVPDSVTPGELFGCIRRRYEKDGSLYTIPLRFSFDTIAVSSDFCKDNKEWTVDEFIRRYDLSAENGNQLLADSSRAAVLKLIRPGLILEHVDFEKRSCDFDGELFIRELTWLSSLPASRMLSNDRFFDSATYAGGKASGWADTIDSDIRYMMMSCLMGEWGSSVPLGYPSPEGGKQIVRASRYYGISSGSVKKEAAMAFLRYMLEDKMYYTARTFIIGFPVIREMLNTVFENRIGSSYEIDKHYFGNISGGSREFSDRPDEKIFVTIDEAFVSELGATLDSIDIMPQFPKVESIFDEELSALMSGREPGDIAKNLQSRIGVLLAESK